jgi:hypothetical protein
MFVKIISNIAFIFVSSGLEGLFVGYCIVRFTVSYQAVGADILVSAGMAKHK